MKIERMWDMESLVIPVIRGFIGTVTKKILAFVPG
jgi:hypothetical protein